MTTSGSIVVNNNKNNNNYNYNNNNIKTNNNKSNNNIAKNITMKKETKSDEKIMPMSGGGGVGIGTGANNNNNNSQQQQQQQHNQNQQTRVMQSDEDFNIRFVNLVREHKCLYDKKVPEYRNRDNQEKSWSLISQETKESVIHCKERWRNLRACLSRYIKQQSGSEPQHKPYYLTEHMSFLLPFLKSTRNSYENSINGCGFFGISAGGGSNNGGGNGSSNCANSLAALFQISQHHQLHAVSTTTTSSAGGIQVIPEPQLQHFNSSINGDHHKTELKHSLSDNDDEETIDAFDPAITGSLQQHHHQQQSAISPQLSDTASAITLQNFIPDVQLSELNTPDQSQDIVGQQTPLGRSHHLHHQQQQRRNTRDFLNHNHQHNDAKRIKLESQDGAATADMHPLYPGMEADMEFFRSILPDLATLTPQQKRKFKIGLLELIDTVVESYPPNGVDRLSNNSNAPTTTTTNLSLSCGSGSVGNGVAGGSNVNFNNNSIVGICSSGIGPTSSSRQSRRGSWRK